MNKVAVGAVTGLGGDAVSPEETVRGRTNYGGQVVAVSNPVSPTQKNKVSECS
jgi:hypothetical protein